LSGQKDRLLPDFYSGILKISIKLSATTRLSSTLSSDRKELVEVKLRRTRAQFAEANPLALFELRRVATPFIPAATRLSSTLSSDRREFVEVKLQGILTKANKTTFAVKTGV